jgi:hypothetical protein
VQRPARLADRSRRAEVLLQIAGAVIEALHRVRRARPRGARGVRDGREMSHGLEEVAIGREGDLGAAAEAREEDGDSREGCQFRDSNRSMSFSFVSGSPTT